MRARHCSEFSGQCEGDEEVRDRQQQTLLFFQPVIGLLVLAFGTVPVLTRVITVVLLVALLAVIELAAETLGAAFGGKEQRRMAMRLPVLARGA